MLNGAGRAWVLRAKLVLVPCGIAFILYLALGQQPDQIAERASARLLVGVALSQVAMAAFALRFLLVMRLVDLRIGFVDALRIHMQSLFYFFFVPMQVGAEIAKFAKLSALLPEAPKVTAAGGIVLDRAIGFCTLLATAAVVGGVFVPLDELRARLHPAVLVLPAAIVVVALYVGRRVLRERLAALDVRAYLDAHRGEAVLAVAISLGMQLLMAAAVATGGRGVGVEVLYAEVLLVMSLALLSQVIPVNVAGAGAAEVVGAGLYVLIGFSAADAAVLVSLTYAYRLLAALIGGAWELAASRRGAT